jgi:Family of unknown function (DUF6502)
VTDTLRAAVQAAVLRMLDPLVRLLLRVGMGWGDFLALIKVAYVRVARDQGEKTLGELRPNVSRIAAVTGLTRAETAAILAADAAEWRTSDRGRHRAERVLAAWWNDPAFQTPTGEPAVLPLSGSRKSFQALVERYSNEPRAMPILKDLLRVKAVRKRADGMLQAVSRSYATVRWDPAGIESLGEQIKEHCATLLHNLEDPARPLFVRRLVNAQLDPKYRALLVRDIQDQLTAVATSLDDALNHQGYTVKAKAGEQEAMRLGVGFYVFEEPVILEPAATGRKRRIGSGREDARSARG